MVYVGIGYQRSEVVRGLGRWLVSEVAMALVEGFLFAHFGAGLGRFPALDGFSNDKVFVCPSELLIGLNHFYA